MLHDLVSHLNYVEHFVQITSWKNGKAQDANEGKELLTVPFQSAQYTSPYEPIGKRKQFIQLFPCREHKDASSCNKFAPNSAMN